MSTVDDSYAACIRRLGEADFYAGLNRLLSGVAAYRHPLCLWYPASGAPRLLYQGPGSDRELDRQMQAYMRGPYLLDPFFQLGQRGAAEGVYRLQQLAPDDFKASEFYLNYYKGTGIADELCFLQVLADGGQLHVCISRELDDTPFDVDALARFEAIAPQVNALVFKHWQLVCDASSGPVAHGLCNALQQFGERALTPREQGIVQLILSGHSSKSIARELGIALATVKHHRKHAYQKLDIHTEAELFKCFFDSVTGGVALPVGEPASAGH